MQEVRRSTKSVYARNSLYDSFNSIKQVRKKQTFELFFTEDAKIIAARKPETFWDSIFGRNELFVQQIKRGNIADAFVRLTQQISKRS